MARINIIGAGGEMEGWYDPRKCDAWDDGTRWDGENQVSLATGVVGTRETLYRTPGGRWVICGTTRWSGGRETNRFVSRDQAREWLLISEYESEEVARIVGEEIEEERGPGRPSVLGDVQRVNLNVPTDLLARVDDAADAAGVTRAEWIRSTLAGALAGG